MFDCSKYEYVDREVFSRSWENDDRPLLLYAEKISIVNVSTVPLTIQFVSDACKFHISLHQDVA